MIIREAYRDKTHVVCRHHYDSPPSGSLPLGPVVFGSRGPDMNCCFCREAIRLSMARPVRVIARELRAATPRTPVYYRLWVELEEAVRRVGDRQADIDRKVDAAWEEARWCPLPIEEP